MKSFYQHLDEVSKHNRSDENNRFKDQHDVQLFKHPVASEAQHTGEIEGKVGTTKRLADDGTDSNYDAAYIKKTGSDEGGGRRLGEETELQEATDLFDKGGIMITRYAAGGGKLGVQVSVGRNYIQLTEPQMKMLASALPKAQKDLRKGLRNESIEEASCGSKPKKEAYPEVKPNELIKKALMGGKKTKTENQSQDVANKMSDASAPSKEGKKKVTLKKAPWEKNEEVELDESAVAYHQKMSSYHNNMHKNLKADGMEREAAAHKKAADSHGAAGKSRGKLFGGNKKLTKTANDHSLDANSASKGYERDGKKIPHTAPKSHHESVELIDEMVRAGNMKLKDGSTVKVSNEDAKLLTTMLKGLNAKNRNEMKNVMMMDKAGYEVIRGFAREAL